MIVMEGRKGEKKEEREGGRKGGIKFFSDDVAGQSQVDFL
jgi:hypothetical protein